MVPKMSNMRLVDIQRRRSREIKSSVCVCDLCFRLLHEGDIGDAKGDVMSGLTGGDMADCDVKGKDCDCGVGCGEGVATMGKN